jgi:hypothetical integral membrane protein (TIGR02206 family)
MNDAPPLELFGPAHLCAITLTLLLPVVLAITFRGTKSILLDRAVRWSLATLLIANYIAYVVYRWQHGYVDWREMLPMQLCDWTMIAVVVALFKENRERWIEVAYFWGIGGSLQAIFTPNLQFGFPDFRFFTFFLDHGAIVAGILYLMLSRRFRPTLASVWRTRLWSEMYWVVALMFDEVTGVNYGFLLHKPQASSLLSLLSDWRPLYILQMNLVAIFFFALLYAPFAIFDLMQKRVIPSEARDLTSSRSVRKLTDDAKQRER